MPRLGLGLNDGIYEYRILLLLDPVHWLRKRNVRQDSSFLLPVCRRII